LQEPRQIQAEQADKREGARKAKAAKGCSNKWAVAALTYCARAMAPNDPPAPLEQKTRPLQQKGLPYF